MTTGTVLRSSILICLAIYTHGDLAAQSKTFIFSADTGGDLIKLDSDRNEIWRARTGAVLTSVAINTVGELIVAGEDERVRKFDAGSGREIRSGGWPYRAGSKVYALAADDRHVYLGLEYSQVKKIDVNTASEIRSGGWPFTRHTDKVFTVAVDKVGNVYSGDDNGNLFKISSDGHAVWRFSLNSNVTAVAVDSDGFAYGAWGDKRLRKIAPDGRELTSDRWPIRHFDEIDALAIGSDGFLYAGSGKSVRKYDRSSGREIWSYTRLSGDASALAVDDDGYVYIGDTDESLYRLSSDGRRDWRFTGHDDDLAAVAVMSSTAPPMTEPGAATFYSRASGFWSSTETWSMTGHTGAQADRLPGIEGDDVHIGNGHTVTMDGDVNGPDLVRIHSGGTLLMESHVISGTGTFTLADDGILGIGSADGIRTGGSAGNVQTSDRNFSREATYIYHGTARQVTGDGLPPVIANLIVDNPAGVSISRDIALRGTLRLAEGALESNGRLTLLSESPTHSALIAHGGRGSIAGSVTIQRHLAGGEGWRMMSSPLAVPLDGGSEALLSNVWTEGASGAKSPSGNPSTFAFSEREDQWQPVTDLRSPVERGRGYSIRIFTDDTPSIPGAWPKTLSVSGPVSRSENDGSSVRLPVSYSDRTDGESGWNLVSNPFVGPIRWNDDPGQWQKSNLGATIYIWNPNRAGGADYEVFTELDNHPIAPFQAFWVRTTGRDPVLAVNSRAKSESAEFYGKTEPQIASLWLDLSKGDRSASARILFTERGRRGPDRYDGYRLAPVSDTYLTVHGVREDGAALAIKSLPLDLGEPAEIPVAVGGRSGGSEVSGSFTLSWGKVNLPGDWHLVLLDRKTSAEVDMSGQSSYSFDVEAEDGGIPISGVSTPGSTTQMLTGGSARFVVRVAPHETVDSQRDQPVAHGLVLHPNYPNPVNGETTIRYVLAERSSVRLAVYDVLGREVDVLVNATMAGGTHEISWHPRDQPPGLYLYRLEAEGKMLTRKMLVVQQPLLHHD